jgi:hypothetical protein
MKAESTNKYQKERNIPVLVDSLQELFQEQGDKVTPTELAVRMEQKLHSHISQFFCRLYIHNPRVCFLPRNSYICWRDYIVPNLELLAERQAQFCQHDTNESDKS